MTPPPRKGSQAGTPAPPETILEAAVARGWPEMSRAELAAQCLELLNQVGELEKDRAETARTVAAISARCFWRAAGWCEAGCPGRSWCEVKGLRPFALVETTPALKAIAEDGLPPGRVVPCSFQPSCPAGER